MALLMPDINLRRARQHIERYWQCVLRGEDPEITNNASKKLSAPTSHSKNAVKKTRRKSRNSSMHSITLPEKMPLSNSQTLQIDAYLKSAPPSTSSTSVSSTSSLNANNQQKLSLIPIRVKDPITGERRSLIVNQTPPTSHSSQPKSNTSSISSASSISSTGSRRSRFGPSSRSKYITRIPGPTLGSVMQNVYQNEGNVTELDFSNLAQRNRWLEPSGGILVARALIPNRTVRRLIIRDHNIGDEGAIALADMLCWNSTLEYIDLYSNGISDVGARALAQALYGHESLIHLSLWSNHIGTNGAEAFAEALKYNRTLKYLGLAHNRISVPGAQALQDALEVNIHLETLNIACNRIPQSLITKIRTILARNRLEASKMISEMECEDAAVASRLATTESEDDESESSGFLSCSGAHENDDGVWI